MAKGPTKAVAARPKARSKVCKRCGLRPRALRSIWCRECNERSVLPPPPMRAPKSRGIKISIEVGELGIKTIISQDLLEQVELICAHGYSLVRVFELGIEHVAHELSGGGPRAEKLCAMCNAEKARPGKDLGTHCWQARGSMKGE